MATAAENSWSIIWLKEKQKCESEKSLNARAELLLFIPTKSPFKMFPMNPEITVSCKYSINSRSYRTRKSSHLVCIRVCVCLLLTNLNSRHVAFDWLCDVYIKGLRNEFAICFAWKLQEFCYNSSHMCSSLPLPGHVEGKSEALLSFLHFLCNIGVLLTLNQWVGGICTSVCQNPPHQPVFICVCVPHLKQTFASPVRLLSRNRLLTSW